MPREIVPILPEGSISIQARTQMPSAGIKKEDPAATPSQQFQDAVKPEPKEAPPQEKDERILKARLVQERLKRQLNAEKKKIDDERRQLEIEKASSRKWLEAEQLAQSGRYLEAAQKAGLSYDQLTQQILNGGQVAPQQIAQETAEGILQKKLEEFKAEQKKEADQARQQQYNATLKQISSDVKHLVDSSENYPLAKASESYDDITREIVSEFHRTGRIIPIEEAVKRWEDEALSGLEELHKLEPVRNRLLKESPKPPEERTPTTLSSRTMAPIPSPKSLTDSERKQRAIDAFYGRLT